MMHRYTDFTFPLGRGRTKGAGEGVYEHHNSGFTLLEVIIALVVLSSALIPLFMLFSTHLDAMRRLADENEKAAATHTIMNFMDNINPAEMGSGQNETGGYSYSWESTAILPLEKIPKGAFKVGLYDTKIEVEKKKDQPWFDFTLRLTGYERIKEAENRPPPPLPEERDSEKTPDYKSGDKVEIDKLLDQLTKNKEQGESDEER